MTDDDVERLKEAVRAVNEDLARSHPESACRLTLELEPAAVRYPHDHGDAIVLGPGVVAARDGSVINWQGQNYTPAEEVNRS